MKVKVILPLFLFLTVLNIHSIDFEKYGFSIPVLDSEVPGEGVQAIQMWLPYENGFTANVNVQIQPFPGTLEEYEALSQQQFASLSLEVVRSYIKADAYYVEYYGTLNNMFLHFYGKALKSGDFVYLATGTDLHANWENSRDQLVDVVNEFKLLK